MGKSIDNGTIRDIDGRRRIYYDGYWIRYYPPPEESLAARRTLIENLTRRTFHHTEPGINTPGERLDQAREAYEKQTDPLRRRVNAAMLAGALFNRAADIFSAVVALQEKGVQISRQNELMRQCGKCFHEALELGVHVRHNSGDEGLDELWGEPFRAFTAPIAQFYETRYLKISQTMQAIDLIGATLINALAHRPGWNGVRELLCEITAVSRMEAEIMRSDEDYFEVWPRFVAAKERLITFAEAASANDDLPVPSAGDACRLACDGCTLLSDLAGARIPMPKSTAAFLERCEEFLISPPAKST